MRQITILLTFWIACASSLLACQPRVFPDVIAVPAMTEEFHQPFAQDLAMPAVPDAGNSFLAAEPSPVQAESLPEPVRDAGTADAKQRDAPNLPSFKAQAVVKQMQEQTVHIENQTEQLNDKLVKLKAQLDQDRAPAAPVEPLRRHRRPR